MLEDAVGHIKRAGTGSFMVRILFRENATCQGEISWVEGGKTRYFRSILEMTVLMQRALTEGESSDSCNGIRSWDWDEDDRGSEDRGS